VSTGLVVRLRQSAVGREVTELPGHPGKKVLRGAPILGSYQERRLLSTFPVHDSEDLDRLYTEWSRNTFSPPLNRIR